MRRILLLIGILALSAILLSACGGSNSSQNQGTAPQTGQSGTTGEKTSKVDATAVYQANCASCHGQNLEGNVGPALNHIGATLSKDQILATIKNGKGIMPANIIQGDDAEAIASWLVEKK